MSIPISPNFIWSIPISRNFIWSIPISHKIDQFQFNSKFINSSIFA